MAVAVELKMSATSTQQDDEDLLAEFDDLLDDTTAHSGSAVAGGTPVVASAEIQQRPVGAASAASTLAPAGVPRVATAEEAEAAFNFDPDAALAESRDHVSIERSKTFESVATVPCERMQIHPWYHLYFAV